MTAWGIARSGTPTQERLMSTATHRFALPLIPPARKEALQIDLRFSSDWADVGDIDVGVVSR